MKKGAECSAPLHDGNSYLPFGLGELLPLPPPEGFPVVLGAFGGLDVPFAMTKLF